MFSWPHLTLIDRHILREWFGILCVVLAATVGLLLIQAMYDDFRDLIDAGAAVVDVVIYFAVKIPSFLAIILPVVLLVSLLYSLGQLHRNNEITAMRAAGLGVFRITRGLWVAGVVMCGWMWVLNASVVPWSVEASRDVLEHLHFTREAATSTAERVGLTRSVTFDNQRQGRMWFINRFSRFTQRAYGVNVSELDGQRREKTRIMAREARYLTAKGHWVFYKGRETWLDPETQDVTRTVAFEEKAVPHFNEDPALMLVFDVKPDDLSFFELRRIIDYFTVEENPKVTLYALRYYSLLADTVAPLIILAIAIPFAIAGVRVNPAVGVSKAIGLFLVYFVLLRFANAVGSRGIVEPLTAALIPNVAMLGVGAWFMLRLR